MLIPVGKTIYEAIFSPDEGIWEDDNRFYSCNDFKGFIPIVLTENRRLVGLFYLTKDAEEKYLIDESLYECYIKDLMNNGTLQK